MEGYMLGRRTARRRMVRIPGLGKISLRRLGGIGVLVVAGGWWLTPWAPVRIRPPVLPDLTGLLTAEGRASPNLAEDLVAVMLVLPNDSMAIVQPPQPPAWLRRQTRAVWDNAASYPLAMRCLAAGDFAAARSHLERAAAEHEIEPLAQNVLGAQVEMYAGRFLEAARGYSAALKLRADDPMLWCQLAAAWLQAGQFDAAAPALDAAERLCGQAADRSQGAMAACRHVGSLLAMARSKDFDEVVKSIEEARETCKRAVGEKHVLVAANLNNEAVLYVLRGSEQDVLLSGAGQLFDFSLAIGTETQGAGDPHLATVRCNLALLHYRNAHYDKAEELLAKAAGVPADPAFQSHPARIASLNLQAMLCRAEGRCAAGRDDPALVAVQEGLGIAQKTLQPEHPWGAVLAGSLAAVYVDHARYVEARSQAAEAERLTEKLWGPQHPFLAEQRNRLAAICTLQEAYEEANGFCRQAQKIAERSFGKQHPVLADILATRGRLEIAQGRPRDAAKPLARARDIYEAVYGKEHPAMARILGDLASLGRDPAGLERAIGMYAQAIDIMEKSAGPEHPLIARLLGGMAALEIEQEKFDDAQQGLDRALDIQRKMLAPNHPDLAATLKVYARLLTKRTPPDPDGAAKVQAQAEEILARHRQEDQ
jgi:tetratricopeptide (TPR) repeat protein